MKISPTTRNNLMQFIFGEKTPGDFARWLYVVDPVEAEIGPERYLALVELDFESKDDIERARKQARAILEADANCPLEVERAITVAEEMLQGVRPMRQGARILSDLRNNGADFIPVDFVGYSSEIERLDSEGFYKRRLLEDTRKLVPQLKKLKSGLKSV